MHFVNIFTIHSIKLCEEEQRYSSTCFYSFRYMEMNSQYHTPTALPPGKESHRIGGSVDPRAGLDDLV
jgi:hypothetical protein